MKMTNFQAVAANLVAEGDVCDLACAKPATQPETDTQIAPIIQKLGATSIADIDNLVSELQEARVGQDLRGLLAVSGFRKIRFRRDYPSRDCAGILSGQEAAAARLNEVHRRAHLMFRLARRGVVLRRCPVVPRVHRPLTFFANNENSAMKGSSYET